MEKSSEQSSGLTKREFLRKVIVAGSVTFVVGGGYVRPELQTLLGPQVAHATGSHSDAPQPADTSEISEISEPTWNTGATWSEWRQARGKFGKGPFSLSQDQ